MFKKFKSMDEAFRQVRWLSLVAMGLSAGVTTWVVGWSFAQVAKADNRIYLLSNGKVLEAVARDREDNLAVEARDQLKTFHRLFFNLDPDDKSIRAGMGRAMYLADGSAKRLYDDQVEKGYIGGLISGNISQSVVLDSIWLDLNSEPYQFRCLGLETLTRSTSVTTRSFISQGYLRSVARSDNNPHGLLIERLEVVENRDLKTQNR